MTAQTENTPDRIHLTLTAEITLQVTLTPGAQNIDQLAKPDQILNPKRATTPSHLHEHIHRTHIRPARRQRRLNPVNVEEEHPCLAPRVAQRHEHELTTHPRMKRMDHTNSPRTTIAIRRSRKLFPKARSSGRSGTSRAGS